MNIPRKLSWQVRLLTWAIVWMVGGLAHSFLAPQCARAQQAALEGERVAEIRVVDASGEPAREKRPALALEVGKPFDFAAERESLRALYRTGDYADIRVTTSPVKDGLRVDFIVTQNYFNNVVSIEGLKEPPSEAAALAAMRLNLGEPFRESSLREALERLREALRADGLYEAKISWALTPHLDTRQMDIAVSVDPGPRVRVGAFILRNQTPFPDAELVRRSKISNKKELTSARITRGTQRLKKYLVNQGYLGAGVVITPGTYDATTNLVPLIFQAITGPRVSIDVSGARLSKGKAHKLLPIYAEGAVDEDLLQEGRRNIRDYFQREGYFDVDVQVSSHDDPKSGERVINYAITRGDRFRLAGISFGGNKYFNNELLLSRLQLQPASFASSGRFSQRLVRDDADSIRALYFSNGFRDAQVTSSVDDNYNGKKGNLFVSFHVAEGPQSLVEDLKVEGNHTISTDAILAVVGSSAGQPYSEAGVASDRNNILAMYYNEGFPQAHFQEVVQPGGTPNRVVLTYQIVEGPRVEVSKVLLTGYQYTRPGIIRRQVDIESGGPLREGDVVESQRRLYNLGVFNRVTIAPQNPNGTDPEKAMVVETREGKRYTIGYGFGFEVQRLAGGSENPSGTTIGASPRGLFEISRANMFGRAQTLSFKVRASTLQYRTVLSYTADNFLTHRNLSLQLTGFADKTQDVNTFNSTRLEGSLLLIQNLSPGSSLLYRYFYRRVTASDLHVSPDEIPLLSQPTLVSGFGLTYARDRRDNSGDPKRGTFNTADGSVAIRALGSSASFYRGYFQNSSFYTFGRAFVFARSARFGIELPIGNTVSGIPTVCTTSGTTTQPIIPLPERFFAGGGTSLRGFGLNQAGPRDPCTGFPIGGLTMLIFNQELRFPMKLPFIGNRLGGTLFYDGGNVYSDINNVSFAWKSSSLTSLNYFSHTVGFGLRYPTPVGPVRVDFGYQLNPAQYQATVPPSTVPMTFRLPHFQFSFNIGPIF